MLSTYRLRSRSRAHTTQLFTVVRQRHRLIDFNNKRPLHNQHTEQNGLEGVRCTSGLREKPLKSIVKKIVIKSYFGRLDIRLYVYSCFQKMFVYLELGTEKSNNSRILKLYSYILYVIVHSSKSNHTSVTN